jgi:hypothetical protein
MICITISCRMDTSNQGASFIGSAYSSTSSTTQRICFCERPTVVKPTLRETLDEGLSVAKIGRQVSPYVCCFFVLCVAMCFV